MATPPPPRAPRTAPLPRVNIGTLRSRGAVLAAMREHDQLPPGEFLRRYGYGEPKRYWIVEQGRRYPSKAILGVAWHYEDPSRPPLRPSQFSGGETTVQQTAEALGFRVVVDDDAESVSAAPEAANMLSAQLTVGEIYSRAQLAQLLDMDPNGMGTGVFRRRGSDSVLIFVTEHKPADRTQYVDRLEGDVLYWEGQESRRTDPLVIEQAERGLELLVFYRKHKNEFPDYSFRYLGPFAYVSHTTPPGAGASSFVLRAANGEPTIAVSIPAVEGDDQAFDPTDLEDARDEVIRAIKARRGQAGFRLALIAADEARCAISGCAVLDVLEAAHILPYRGAATNHPANGLLLRADLHTLFDCGLLSIAPVEAGGFRVQIAPPLFASEYRNLHGQPLRARKAGAVQLSAEAVQRRHADFVRMYAAATSARPRP